MHTKNLLNKQTSLNVIKKNITLIEVVKCRDLLQEILYYIDSFKSLINLMLTNKTIFNIIKKSKIWNYINFEFNKSSYYNIPPYNAKTNYYHIINIVQLYSPVSFSKNKCFNKYYNKYDNSYYYFVLKNVSYSVLFNLSLFLKLSLNEYKIFSEFFMYKPNDTVGYLLKDYEFNKKVVKNQNKYGCIRRFLKKYNFGFIKKIYVHIADICLIYFNVQNDVKLLDSFRYDNKFNNYSLKKLAKNGIISSYVYCDLEMFHYNINSIKITKSLLDFEFEYWYSDISIEDYFSIGCLNWAHMVNNEPTITEITTYLKLIARRLRVNINKISNFIVNYYNFNYTIN